MLLTLFSLGHQNSHMSGRADRSPALLPQQGRATRRDSRGGRQSVQSAHRAESAAGGRDRFLFRINESATI